jgi:hypothetical protein
MNRIQRIRKVTAIAVATTRAIFRSGRLWGTARTRIKVARRHSPKAGARAGAVAGVAAGAAGAYFLDPQNGSRRRHIAFDKAKAWLRRGAAEGAPVQATGG